MVSVTVSENQQTSPDSTPEATPVPSEQTDLPAEASARRWLRTPPIDIFETPEGLTLRADLPGVTVDSLELQVQDNKLTLFGRANLDLPDDTRLAHQEYHVGDFLRSFIISDDVDHDRITAKLNDGVLELSLPRAPRGEPRKIQVNTE